MDRFVSEYKYLYIHAYICIHRQHDDLQAMCSAAEAPLVATGGKDGQVCFNVCVYISIHVYMHIYIYI